MKWKLLSRVQLFETPWTIESLEFSRPEHWLLLLLSCFSRVQLSATPQTVAHQAPLSMGVSRWEYWSGLPWSPPRDLPNPGTEPRSPILYADSLPAKPQGSSRILEWVAYPFSSESSWPRNWTGFFYIASGFFTNWASRETPLKLEFTRKLLLQETGFTGHFLSAYLQNHSTIQ